MVTFLKIADGASSPSFSCSFLVGVSSVLLLDSFVLLQLLGGVNGKVPSDIPESCSVWSFAHNLLCGGGETSSVIIACCLRNGLAFFFGSATGAKLVQLEVSSKTSELVDRDRKELIVVEKSSEDWRSECLSYEDGRLMKGDGGKSNAVA